MLSITHFLISIALLHHATSDKAINEIADFNDLLKTDNSLVVLFTQPCCACTDCVEAEVLLGGMSQQLEENLGLMVVRLKDKQIRSRYGIKKVPAMVYIRENKTAPYDGPFDFDSVYDWLQDNRQPSTADLDDSSFEHLTQAASGATTGDWLVLFHDGSCLRNRELMHLESAGIKLKNRVNVASVDTKKSPETAKRFKISACPEIIFFRHMKMYRFSLTDVNDKTLRRFAEGFYKNSKAEKVPVPPSVFDKLLERTFQFYLNNWYSLLVGLALTTVCTTTCLICAVLKPRQHKKAE